MNLPLHPQSAAWFAGEWGLQESQCKKEEFRQCPPEHPEAPPLSLLRKLYAGAGDPNTNMAVADTLASLLHHRPSRMCSC